jgi:hypothetical protein
MSQSSFGKIDHLHFQALLTIMMCNWLQRSQVMASWKIECLMHDPQLVDFPTSTLKIGVF